MSGCYLETRRGGIPVAESSSTSQAVRPDEGSWSAVSLGTKVNAGFLEVLASGWMVFSIDVNF